MPGAAPLISPSGSSNAAQWHRWVKLKEIQLLGAVFKRAAAIPAAVGEDWESPYGFTPSELLPFLPPSPPPNNHFPLTTFKLSNTTQEQSCDKRPGSQFLLECTQHRTLGKWETAQERATPSLNMCFPAGNVIYSQVEAAEGSLMVHTAAGPGEWGKRETEIFLYGLS